jgi:hypothetical protein
MVGSVAKDPQYRQHEGLVIRDRHDTAYYLSGTSSNNEFAAMFAHVLQRRSRPDEDRVRSPDILRFASSRKIRKADESVDAKVLTEQSLNSRPSMTCMRLPFSAAKSRLACPTTR